MTKIDGKMAWSAIKNVWQNVHSQLMAISKILQKTVQYEVRYKSPKFRKLFRPYPEDGEFWGAEICCVRFLCHPQQHPLVGFEISDLRRWTIVTSMDFLLIPLFHLL